MRIVLLANGVLSLTQSSLRRRVLKAATRDRHLSLSAAARVAVCMVRPLDFSSLFIVRRQVSFGLPLFLWPWGVQVSAVLGMALVGILQTRPNHLQRRALMVSEMVVMFVLSRRFSFLMVFGQKMPKILRRHLVWNTSSFCSMTTVVFQHSAPYSKTLRTLLLNILTLVFRLRFLFFQIERSIPKACPALLILEFISLIQSPSGVTLLPK